MGGVLGLIVGFTPRLLAYSSSSFAISCSTSVNVTVYFVATIFFIIMFDFNDYVINHVFCMLFTNHF